MITSSNGLSQSTINCLHQDKDGLLWIGTQDGLNLYDGNSFVYFHNQPGDTLSISDNYILSICEDLNGNLWLGTMSGGLNKFCKKTREFTRYQTNAKSTQGISNNTVWAVTTDIAGNIFAGTNYGLNIFHPKSGIFSFAGQNESDSSSISNLMISGLFLDRNNNLWVGTQKGLFIFDQKKKEYYPIVPKENSQDENMVVWVIREVGNLVFVGTNRGIWKANPETRLLKKLPLNETFNTCWALNFVSENSFLAGTQHGLFHVNLLDNSFKEISFQKAKTTDHARNNVWCILPDMSGFYWVGMDEGLMKVNVVKKSFFTLSTVSENKLSLSGPSVMSFLIDSDNTLWVGTDGAGLNLLHNGDNKFQVWKANPGNIKSISGNRIWSLLEDRQGLIWIGTYGGGLNSIDKKSGEIKNYLHNKHINSLSNNRVMAMYEDSRGILWVGTRGGGLNKFDKNSNAFKSYLHDPEDSTSLISNTVLAINEDWQGNIWVGTYLGGLSKFNSSKDSFTNYCYVEDKPDCISNNNVWAILFDNENRMWLGTQGGLNWATEKNGQITFRNITTKQGLPSNVIFGLQQDRKGNIWMSTFRGIAKLRLNKAKWITEENHAIESLESDPFDPAIVAYYEHDGIHGNEFNQGASYKDKQGNIYFGGLKGMTYFHPDSIQSSTYNPKVIISDFKIFNNSVGFHKAEETHGKVFKEGNSYYLTEHITYLDQLTLTYKESVFSFTFSSLDLSFPNQLMYAYKMEGFETLWNFIEDQNSATYTNLDAGHYTFRVKASNCDGQWSSHEAILQIRILPPFWKTTWFLVFISIFVLLVITLAILRLFHIQKRNARAEREKIELQLKTIKNQIDPHFAFNAINMIGSMVYKNDPDTVYDYFSRFAHLIRNTLKDSEKIARPLKDELEFVKNYLEIQKSRFKNKFEFEVIIGESTDQNFQVPKMIIQAYVENAIKHGLMNKEGKGLVSITIFQDSNQLSISVKDDGIGRTKAAEFNKSSTKRGMAIIRQIFDLYKKIYPYQITQTIKDLLDDKGDASGTEVILTITKTN
ncbi:MAG: histidine kinase [Bacteroidales bacterium]|nr:histidine kinase [Bacteroidales bacterium]